MILMNIAAAIALASAAHSGAEAVQGTTTFREFTDFNLVCFSVHGGAYAAIGDNAGPPQGYVIPSAAKDPRCFTLVLAGGKATFLGVLAKSEPKVNRGDLMWIDWNGDKRFDDNEQAAKIESGIPGTAAFRPKAWPVIGGKTVPLVLLVDDTGIQAVPAGYMEAVVPLGGTDVTIGIVDANLNGVYGDRLRGRVVGDFLLIDRTRCGHFRSDAATSMASFYEGDVLPLLDLMQLDRKWFYSVDVSADASTVALTRYGGAYGAVEFVGARARLLMLDSPTSQVLATVQAGKVSVPAGSYAFRGTEYELADAKGVRWTFLVRGSLGRNEPARKIAVKTVRPVVLRCGLPLAGFLQVRTSGRTYRFALRIKDGGGAWVIRLGDLKGRRPPRPVLRITDPKGRPVDGGAFEYG